MKKNNKTSHCIVSETQLFNKLDKRFAIASLVFIVISFVMTLLMYLEVVPNNFIVWFTYPASVLCLILSFRHYGSFSFRKILSDKEMLIAVLGVSLLYLLIHIYKINTAPWNNYGLFDDAAWDIFDARLKCFRGDNFEIIFFDALIGIISRELVFHYYISIFFRLFGYNLAVFNAALVFLGWITVIFTLLSVKELTDNVWIAVCSALTLMFLPLEFTQVYMGHRYAICGPLLMISYYFILKAYKKSSVRHAAVAGIFTGLTMSSAIMGKQFLYGLIFLGLAYGLYYLVKERGKLFNSITVTLTGLIGYIAANTPLYAYIFTHREQYNIRQDSMIKDFLQRIREEGLAPVIENIKALLEVLFGKETELRQFSPGYPVFTWFYLVFFIIGIIYLIWNKKFNTIIFAMIPIAGCVIALAYDFRILISAPFIAYIITSGVFGTAELVNRIYKTKKDYSCIAACVLTIVMLIPQIRYLKALADDPNSLWHLPHHSVAISRYMQDLALGADEPGIEMKNDEFNLGNTNDRYDLYIAIKGAYGHLHAYLGEESSREILKLTGDFPYVSQSDEEIRHNVYSTIQEYVSTGKDLMLAFEYSEQVKEIISELEGTGVAEVNYYSQDIDGAEVSVCTVYVQKDFIEKFKESTAQYLTAEF